MTNYDALFNQADTNQDGVLTRGEFQTMMSRNSSVGNDVSYGTSGFSTGTDLNNLVGGRNYGSSSFQSSSYDTSNAGGDLNYIGGGYDSSAYRSSVGNIGGDFSNVNASYNIEGAAISSSSDAASARRYSTASQSVGVQQYETDAQGNFKDSNPQVIRRPAQGGPLNYTQNIKVRFLRPPAVPPPGPLIIKEVRPPQPPAPAPLVVRQRAPPLAQQPPLVLRERPPPTPASVASQTVVRNLAAIPVPPRSVVIERLPPDPPKPRDIIIERWIPYGAAAKRKTIVQRAEAIKEYARPRNVIIQYEAPQVRVMRQFQRLGITQEDPQAYIQRYGATLFDTTTLLQQVRAAGVVEDISPPNLPNSFASSASEFSSSSPTGGVGFEASGIDTGIVRGGGGGARSSFYDSSSSYSTSGDVSGLAAGTGVSSYESSAYRSSIGGFGGGIDGAFAAADTNNDGVLSQAEFRNAGY